MSDEHDSWFKDAFGVDLGQAVQGIKDEASAAVNQVQSTVTQVVQGVQGAVEGAISTVTGAVTGAVKKVAGAVSPSGEGGGGGSGAGGGTGTFPLGGSVGRGGKNAANDVRAVQAALGIAADGQCGAQTIAAIEAFQRNKGQARPDGRVDAGGATERALAGGSSTTPTKPTEPDGDDLRSQPGVPEDGPADNAGTATTDDAARDDQIRTALTAEINAQTENRGGLINELNDLDDFRKTDPDPVPAFTASFAGTDPKTLANDIKEKEFAIDQMERQRTNICKAARADARLASEGAKSDLKGALLGGAGVGTGGAVATAVASLAGSAMAGGSLAMLGVLFAGIIAEHEVYRKYRDTIRSIVNKAHADLTIANTAIAVERNKLDAMKKAANQPVGDEVLIKPFVRPASENSK